MGDIVGIALDGNLRRVRAVDVREETAELVVRESARSAPTYIYRLPFLVAISRAQIHLPTECRYIFFSHAGGGGRVEPAVDTTRLTKGYMNV